MREVHERAIRQFDELPDAARVRVQVVAVINGISVPTVWRWSKDGKLPEPSRCGNVTTWGVGELRRAKKAA